MIMLPVTTEDTENLEAILTNTGFKKPNMKISVYKNRRGRWKSIYLWCSADLGTCRIQPIFATSWSYELIQMQNYKIETVTQFN